MSEDKALYARVYLQWMVHEGPNYVSLSDKEGEFDEVYLVKWRDLGLELSQIRKTPHDKAFINIHFFSYSRMHYSSHYLIVSSYYLSFPPPLSLFLCSLSLSALFHFFVYRWVHESIKVKTCRSYMHVTCKNLFKILMAFLRRMLLTIVFISFHFL